ncbi:hypothetical protein [Alteromonas gilva]|uniref:Uncharacterized protein n=1 Tax=Alteromonas gilva TaxID=2987522 RepID=A0ABT5L8N9_9ALTE|nr:hypothetical protein [Alteromonas gilva]MDC8832836.1 hypothetical protein [Alteromonas gilva]
MQQSLFEFRDDMAATASPAYLPFTQGNSLLVDGVFECEVKSRKKIHVRQTRPGDAVSVYRNLNKYEKQMFSVMHNKGELKQRVAGYGKVVVLKATPERPLSVKLSESSRQRVLREQRKNVHAMIKGTFIDVFERPLTLRAFNELDTITYNPYKAKEFYRLSDNKHFSGDLPYTYAMVCGSNVYCL